MKQSVLLLITAALAGVLFGLGLILAGMANPEKVLSFLDLAGVWDPSLALVMIGAIGVAALAFAWANQRKSSLLRETIQLPDTTQLDTPLMIGACLFGVGWGLAGICPGPALVLLGLPSLLPKSVVFVMAMAAGMWLASALNKRLK